jgi:EAL domain-containing protein (putative c-di-GMP-specific phosphodiesterase class I)
MFERRSRPDEIPRGAGALVPIVTVPATSTDRERAGPSWDKPSLVGAPAEIHFRTPVSASAFSPDPRHNAVVLVVDDDERVRRALAMMLHADGHEVIAVDNGASALETARERLFDVALVDQNMGDPDGISVLQHLREVQPMCTRVLLTGSLDLDTALDAVNLGSATHVLEKPIGIDALSSVIRTTLHERQRMLAAYQDLQRVHRSAGRMRLLTLLGSDDLRLALQPIVRPDGSAVAYEALLRSADPVLSGPLSVLRAAEDHGLVDRLAEAVAVRAAAILDRLPYEHRLFVNLHPDELRDPEALDDRLRLLQRHSSRVVLEITERSSLADAVGWERSIENIIRRGFTIAVDDLGSGYSSLSVLAELQPRYIKVDMSIVRDVDKIARKQRLFDLLCRFADATDALVVAEGIETAAEAETVQRCGAHLLQGYLFARPELADIVLARFPQEDAA